MGQGYSMTTLSAASASIDTPELADLVHEKTLASARFMKSVRARSQNGCVFVKAVMKPYSTFEVQKYIKHITDERNALANVPNALGYQRIIEVGSGGFLVRQYMFSSVYDRMSTRPFLEDIEKKWMVFQLLCAVRDCHSRNVYHGDIKTENILVTSWNWLYLTDFSSSFKPTHLPEDNPADFSFYFDTSGRRTCYLAPERFSGGTRDNFDDSINWAMDIFSLGCVIAEIFLEGPIFSLSQIFKYRSGDYSPRHTHLEKIEDPEIREMILNMIHLDPENRWSADQYLAFYRSKIFPDYFYSFLHQYMHDLTVPSSGRGPVTLELGTQGESDDKIDRVYYDFDKISYFLGYKKGITSQDRFQNSTRPLQKNSRGERSAVNNENANFKEGTLLFMNIVTASVRNTAKASARLKACELLVLFAEHLSDEAKLDRVLPYVVGLLSDKSDAVKVAALKSMTAILEMVQVVSPINAYIFPEYIFPKLKEYIPNTNSQPSTLVKATYASCLATLAEASARVLDMVQAIRADGRLPALAENEWGPETSFHGLYDVARMELVPHFEEATKALITDEDASVRRAFLGSVSRLCVFFGSSKASDIILSHLNTYLNDLHWILKCTFYDAVVGVATYVGSASLEKFILPVMIQSLTDTENFVVERVFRSLARMANLGLISRSTSWTLISIATRFLIHPSIWIRESAIQFIVASARYTSPADKYCVVLPMIQPFFKSPIVDISEAFILDGLKKPLSKSLMDTALSWASKYPSSTFWSAANSDGVFFLPEPDSPTSSLLSSRRSLTRVPPSQRNSDDQNQLEMLRRLGMSADDEMKLLALREYIFKIAHPRFETPETRKEQLADIIPLTSIKATVQTVFFDTKSHVPAADVSFRPFPLNNDNEPHTLTDALLDASTSIGNTDERRSSSAHRSDGERIAVQRSSNAGELRKPNSFTRTSKKRDSSDGSTPTLTVPSNGNPINGDESSPSDLDKASFRRNSSLGMRSRNSAINLLNRNDTSKAIAETSTTSENAFGKLDGPYNTRRPTEPSALSLAADKSDEYQALSHLPSSAPNHSYLGADPHILRLLDNHFVANFSTDLPDFLGSITHPIAANSKLPIRRATDPPPSQSGGPTSYPVSPWRPSGHLVTMFAEHSAAINSVVAAPDHAFFVTASDDGTCKVWDAMRLEKNVATRSRQTYRLGQGVKVKALCFVENTHTFIAAGDDGGIVAVRVGMSEKNGGGVSQYEKVICVREYQLPPPLQSQKSKSSEEDGPKAQDQEHAVWLFHHRTSISQSVLLAATTHSRILALDLKSTGLSIIYTLSIPLYHGTPTTFTVDPSHHWLLLGTAHGILDLWDLRFRLRLRSFGLPTHSRIERLVLHTSKGRGRWVFVSSGGEISVWDLEKLECREVYRPAGAIERAKAYEAWFPDDEGVEKVLARFAAEEGEILPATLPIAAMCLVNDFVADNSKPEDIRRTPLLFTGGADRTLRCWNIGNPAASLVVSGPVLDGDENLKVKYEVAWPLSASAGAQVCVVSEVLPRVRGGGDGGSGTGTGTGSAKSTPSKKSGGGTSERERERAEKSKPARNSVISAAARRLLRTHVDGISDVLVLRRPYGLVVSVDRGGGLYVFR